MHSSSGFTTLAALLAASLVTGAPVLEAPRLQGRSTFTVPQIKNPGFKGFAASGLAARARAYSKYGIAMPADVAAALKAVTGGVPAIPQEYDSEYLCPVQIGTPAQTLSLDFDTGSADFWVFSSQMPASEVSGQTLYMPGSSSTATLLSGYTWSIVYGDNTFASGDVYDDFVCVGGADFAHQAVECAKHVSPEFTNDTANSGLLGLSFGTLNMVTPVRQKTFFENVMSSLAAPLFTTDLKKGAPGTYDFGYIDPSKHIGGISYAPVNTRNGFWEFTGSGYAVGSSPFKGISIDALADTGTTLLLLPDFAVAAYYAQVSGASYDSSQGGYTFPCSATLPSFTFGIGSYRGVIPGFYMNYAPTGSGKCYGGIQSNDGFGVSIYGDILLKAQFVVFDGGNTSIGFASKKL